MITPDIKRLAVVCMERGHIPTGLYEQYHVLRGLRDMNGKGVLAGLTDISTVLASRVEDGKTVPCDGELYYRGYNIRDLVQGFAREGRMGFEEIAIKNYKPQKGDISVLPTNKRSVFGHVAVYNGQFWVSDFIQKKGMFPSTAYKNNGKYQIFRATDGWHWKHVWTSPVDWYGWIKATIIGRDKIKF